MNPNVKKGDRLHAEDGCNECAIMEGRRSFLRNAALAAVLASIGVFSGSARTARGMSTVLTTGRRNDPANPQSVSYPLPATDGAQIDHGNDVILVRWQNEIYAFNLSCPHQNTALRWDDADHRFQCPKHHSKYQPDGEFISGRATRNMDRFTIRRDAGNNIVVNVDAMFQSDKDPDAWAAATLKV
ncbi:MAG: Rieske (2Fe-2S) protein [Gemmatimonadota bacterium]|nr:Rieske (2Fe-2S) protein [Gemmatimonadota bacterium]